MNARSTPPERIWRFFGVAALFLAVSLSFMGPLGSDTLFPSSPDHPNHTAGVVQAKQAIEEGQFPLRIAPWQHNGLRYAHFQLYSWAPYYLGGVLHKFFYADNPWAALKCVYVLGLWIGGMVLYWALRRLRMGCGSALAGSLVYLTAPYVLTNIYSRGAFTEAMAQAELPLAVVGIAYIVRGHRRGMVLGFAALSFAVYLLANTHIITFIYTFLFFSIFFAILFFTRTTNLVQTGILAGAMMMGALLSAHQIVPIVNASDLQIRSTLRSPIETKKYSPLAVILAVGPAEPEPLGGEVVPDFWPQAGLPILAALGIATYFLARRERGNPAQNGILLGAMSCVILAILTASGTIDIWWLLPKQSYVLQFPYRLLTFAALFGALLAAVVVEIGQTKHKYLFAVMISLATVSAALWQPRMLRNKGPVVEQIFRTPELGYGSSAYLTTQSVLPAKMRGPVALGPVVLGDGWLNLGVKLRFEKGALEQSGGSLEIRGVQAAEAAGCSELHVTIGPKIISVPTSTSPFTATVPASELLRASAGAAVFNVGFDSPCAFVPAGDPRRLFMHVISWDFVDAGKQARAIRGPAAAKQCKLSGANLLCEVNSDSGAEFFLPMLYYADLLRVEVNGVETAYEPAENGGYVVAKVTLPPGRSVITAAFGGSLVGNLLSLASFGCWLLGMGLALWLAPSEDADQAFIA